MIKKYKNSEEYKFNKYTIIKFSYEFIPEITEFVAKIYYKQKHYNFLENLEEVTNEMKENDKKISKDAIVFCIFDKANDLCCTARLIARKNKLPFEKEFEFDLNFFEDEFSEIYEFSRFASNGKISFIVIEKMLRFMLCSIDKEKSLVIAGLDEIVYRKFKRIKYPICRIGKTIHYMGSKTVPIAIKLKKLSFYESDLKNDN